MALHLGSTAIPSSEIWHYLLADDGSLHDRIINELRLPRALSAFAVGAMLALAGALMQVLLRNPLGDPYVLGISGGAASAVLAGMLLTVSAAWLPGLAFLGALLSMLLVFALADYRHDGGDRLLLTGVVIAAGWSALIGFVLSLSPPVRLPGMLFWLMGDLSDALAPTLPLIVAALGLALALAMARDLNLAVYGMDHAAALGVDPKRLRLQVYFLASLLTAVAVSSAGAVGFVGLITPHAVRLLIGSDHRILLPTSAALGGSLLVIADSIARTLISPMQLPVGVLTALLGVPVFLFLLRRVSGR